MHYLLFYDVVPDYLQRRAAHRDAHLALAWAAHDRGDLLLGGAFEDARDGAALLFVGESPAAAEAFAQADPYVLNGLVTRWRVRPWITVAGTGAARPLRPGSEAMTAAPPPVLETERLRVEPFTLADAPFILRLLNTPGFLTYIADKGVRTIEQAEAYLETGPLRSYALHGLGLCRVTLKSSGEAIGMCGLIHREGFDIRDLGYAFLPEFEGQGLATESARAVLAFGRETLGLDRVIALVGPENDRSIRLLVNLGFRDLGMVEAPSISGPCAYYQLDWAAAAPLE